MIRTIEVLFVIIIISGAFIATSYFTVLPSPREVSPINLRRLSFTTLQMLDSDYDLSRAAFETDNATAWSGLQVALSASLPPNVVYNLTVYDVNDQDGQVYSYVTSISNAASLSQPLMFRLTLWPLQMLLLMLRHRKSVKATVEHSTY